MQNVALKEICQVSTCSLVCPQCAGLLHHPVRAVVDYNISSVIVRAHRRYRVHQDNSQVWGSTKCVGGVCGSSKHISQFLTLALPRIHHGRHPIFFERLGYHHFSCIMFQVSGFQIFWCDNLEPMQQKWQTCSSHIRRGVDSSLQPLVKHLFKCSNLYTKKA